jgi:hypothetical protein
VSSPKRQRNALERVDLPTEGTSILDRTRVTLSKSCAALDACIDRVTTTLAEGAYNKDLASHLAWLTKQLAGVTDALRKLEAHDTKTVGQMSPEKRDQLVMAYLKGLPPQRQNAIADELRVMAAGESLLA